MIGIIIGKALGDVIKKVAMILLPVAIDIVVDKVNKNKNNA